MNLRLSLLFIKFLKNEAWNKTVIALKAERKAVKPNFRDTVYKKSWLVFIHFLTTLDAVELTDELNFVEEVSTG